MVWLLMTACPTLLKPDETGSAKGKEDTGIGGKWENGKTKSGLMTLPTVYKKPTYFFHIYLEEPHMIYPSS
jgi:hypothetical protein